MKRLHVHVSVPDLSESIEFYNCLFGTEPTKQKSDYAKWQLEDPRINFAISTRGRRAGLDHLGIQVETESEIDAINQRLQAASQHAGEIKQGVCCYSESSKFWTVDKAGIPWESFITMNDAELYGVDDFNPEDAACCDTPAVAEQQGCC